MNEEALFVYWPLALEVNLMPFYFDFLSKGGHLFFPRIEGNQIFFRRVDDLDASFELGPFSLKEPTLSCPISLEKKYPIIVPGLSFNQSNYRLGYGKGFYDRFLEHYQGDSYGICYSLQIKAWKPEPWDCSVSKLLSF